MSSDEGYNQTPDRDDPADILVCVVSANTLPFMTDENLGKMNRITTAARDYGENKLLHVCNRVLSEA